MSPCLNMLLHLMQNVCCLKLPWCTAERVCGRTSRTIRDAEGRDSVQPQSGLRVAVTLRQLILG